MSNLPEELRGLVAAEQAAAPPIEIPRGHEELVFELLDVRTNVNELERVLKVYKERQDRLRKILIPDKMRELGMVAGDRGNFTHTSGARVHLRVDTYVSVRRTDDLGQPTGAFEEQLHAWLREQGHADLIKEVVNPQTLKAFVRERQDDELPAPPGVAV